jgi:energy-converting hydrogenase Eha subunit F
MRTNHLLALLGLALAAPAHADDVAHRPADAPFAQDWSNAAQPTAPNDGSGVPALEGYRGA